ncbi:MAG: 1-phosphofructokinase family hexose kinase [Clostridia bacterium]|nr:1-phosphofructokinase family hexose kinase [Clostridia bacterium]
MKIITLTLNPAFDVHCFVEDFQPYHENLAKITTSEAGGKGVNISRALTVCGTENLAFVVLGEENGEGFTRAMSADGMTYQTITVAGRIRENITIHTDTADETRISFSGFDAPEDLLAQVEAPLLPMIDRDTVLTLTGRNPSGVGIVETKEMLRRFIARGSKIVIDSRSFELSDLVEMKPWLIKPNQEEISAYLGREISKLDEVVEAARELHEGGIENVMISLGSKGALLVSDEGVFSARPPRIEALSTIGAGDSSIAGFLAATAEGCSAKDCLCRAVAYGTAACLTEGTKPPRPEDVARVMDEIVVEQM